MCVQDEFGDYLLSPIPEPEGEHTVGGEEHEEEDSPEALLRDEVQLLLESYTLRLNNVLNDILLLQKKVKNRQSLTDISMQIQRNRLLWLNLNLGIAAVCIAASTAFSGWFGMNLELGPWLTEDRMAFPVVCTVSTVISGLMYHYTQNYVNSNNYYKEVEKKHVKERQLLKSIFSDIYSIDVAVRQAFTEMEHAKHKHTPLCDELMHPGTAPRSGSGAAGFVHMSVGNYPASAHTIPGENNGGGGSQNFLSSLKDKVPFASGPSESAPRDFMSTLREKADQQEAVFGRTGFGSDVSRSSTGSGNRTGAGDSRLVADTIYDILRSGDSEDGEELRRSFSNSSAFSNISQQQHSLEELLQHQHGQGQGQVQGQMPIQLSSQVSDVSRVRRGAAAERTPEPFSQMIKARGGLNPNSGAGIKRAAPIARSPVNNDK